MDMMGNATVNMSKGSPAGPSSWIDAGLDLDSSIDMLPGFGDDFGSGKLNSFWNTSDPAAQSANFNGRRDQPMNSTSGTDIEARLYCSKCT